MNRTLLTIAIVVAAGCGDAEPAEGPAQSAEEVETGDNSEEPPGEIPDKEKVIDADGARLTDFHEEIFVAEGCTSGYCHGSFALDTPSAVVDAFVDVEASEPLCGRTHFVVPGDPEASILWVRVRPTTAEDEECGVAKMPAGSERGLDEASAEMIYAWIADGAKL